MIVISTWTIAEHRHKDNNKLLVPQRKPLTTSKHNQVTIPKRKKTCQKMEKLIHSIGFPTNSSSV